MQIECKFLSLFSYESDEERNINDAITDQFRAILQDVTVYYTKKLDMYRIKMEHHQRTRPDNGHYELAFILMEIYNDHPNREELWKDMFCRILGPIFLWIWLNCLTPAQSSYENIVY